MMGEEVRGTRELSLMASISALMLFLNGTKWVIFITGR